MKILVTGGAGFIGSHVAELFLQRGHEVIVVDDLSTGHERNLPADVSFHKMDIRSEEFTRLMLDAKPEAVAHLAAQMDVRRSVQEPVLDADINVLGLVRLAWAAMQAGTSRIVFSSTGGAIYGEQDCFPAAEDHPCRPVSPYGTSKLCAEAYLAYFQRAGGPVATVLRYANVYGPRQDPHGEAGVVAIFAGRLLRGQRPVIYGDGAQTRDYVHVRDVARANLLALDHDAAGVFNIGTGAETDVKQLAALMAEKTGFTELPEHQPARPGEQMRSCIHPGLAGRVFDWRPEVELEAGLAETIEYFREDEKRREQPA